MATFFSSSSPLKSSCDDGDDDGDFNEGDEDEGDEDEDEDVQAKR